jgi:hypothetical protein
VTLVGIIAVVIELIAVSLESVLGWILHGECGEVSIFSRFLGKAIDADVDMLVYDDQEKDLVADLVGKTEKGGVRLVVLHAVLG